MVPSFEAGIQSTIVVPMTSDSDVFGALFIHSTEPEAYTEDQVRLAERVGLMLASAVSNALLLKESEMSSRERGIVADIAGMLGSTLDLTEIYAGVVEKIRELLPYDRLSLVRLNVEAGSISSLYSVGVAVPEWLPGVYRPLKGTVFEELTKTRAGLRKSRAPDDGFIESFPGHAPLAKVMDVRSLIAAPLMHQGEAIGALILSSRTPNAYSRSDLELAERVSSQITGAVVNADLFARTEREAYERTLLAKLGQMAGSTLDVQGLYENAATPLNRLIPYDRLSIATFDTEANVWQTAFVAGGALEAAEPGENQSTGSETSKYIAETRQALLLRHPGDHGGRFINNRGFKAGMKSLILVPVVWADQVIAVMALHSQTEYAYGNHELRIAEQAASQIAGAITNARLHARVNQQAREQALLARIGRVISSASSPDNVFDQFMELVLKLIPADRAEITSSGRDGKVVVHCTTLSGPAIPGRRDGDVLPLDGSWTEHIMEGG
jgi:GAF domain-containing protein